jgi:ribose transport system ATP-binding protein
VSGAAETPLTVRGVSKRFGSTIALDGASFDVPAGTIQGLVGGNGSGKSTLIKVLAGVVAADAGEIDVRGQSYAASSFTPRLAWDSGFRFVHQQSSIFPDMTVAENLALGRGFETGRGGRVRWRAQSRQAAEVLARFQIDVRPRDQLSSLSNATQTMIAIARALQDQGDAEQSLLVLDEPTAALPAAEAGTLLDALRGYASKGQSILFISHRFEEILSAADRVTVLRDGRVVTTRDSSELDHDGLVELMLGRSTAQLQASVRAKLSPDAPAKERRPVLELRDLCGGRVRNACLTVHQGEVVGIAGLLGSGRSTLLRLVFGATPIEHGSVRLDGAEVTIRSPRDASRAGIAYVPEDRTRDAAFSELTVGENLSIATLEDYWGRGRLRQRAERAHNRELVSSFQIKCESVGAPLASLSGGNQQKVMLARWIRRKPRLLLLDEPTQGVDVGARAEIHGLIRRATEEGVGVVLVSSDSEEMELLCDRVLVTRAGEITADVGAVDDVTIDRMVTESPA